MKSLLTALLLVASSAQAATQWVEFPVNRKISSREFSSSDSVLPLGIYSYDVPCYYFKLNQLNLTQWDGIGFCSGNLCNQYHSVIKDEAYFGPFNGTTVFSMMKSHPFPSELTLSSVIVGLDSSGSCETPSFPVMKETTPLTLPTYSFSWKGVTYQLSKEPTTLCGGRNEGTFAISPTGEKFDMRGCILDHAVALMYHDRPLMFGRGTDNSVYFRDFQLGWQKMNQIVTEFIPVIQGSQLVIFGITPGNSLVMQNFGYKLWNTLPLDCQSDLSVASNGKSGYLVSCKSPSGDRASLEVQ